MFSHAPWDTHPAHLSRFAVRSPNVLTAQLFLEAWNHRVSEPELRLITSRSCHRVCPYWVLRRPPTCLTQPDQTAGSAHPSPSLLRSTNKRWCRNINLLSITYPFRARLRDRLTHGRIILPQETLGLRRGGFSPPFSLLMPAYSLVMAGSGSYDPPCISMTTLAYHSETESVASVLVLAPLNFRRRFA